MLINIGAHSENDFTLEQVDHTLTAPLLSTLTSVPGGLGGWGLVC